MPKESSSQLLPLRFHCTFKPDRSHMHALLKFAKKGDSGTYQEISATTQIPTGAATGKIIPMIDYCKGMGLITTETVKTGIRLLLLTDFGKVVLQKDSHLNFPVTQWLCHLRFCDQQRGAIAWVLLFAEGASLGRQFTRQDLKNFMAQYFPNKKRIIGPLLTMYTSHDSFFNCGALQEEKDSIFRNRPPMNEESINGYSAWFLELLEHYFPARAEVPLSEFQEITKWEKITGWDQNDISIILSNLESQGFLKIDRHMTPWLVTQTKPVKELWPLIYTHSF